MEKLPEFYKAALAVFHGIIATWLFLLFSETVVDQFQFVILLVFFSVANLLVWNLGLATFRWLSFSKKIARGLPMGDISAASYSGFDVVGLSLVAILIGLCTAYVYRSDVIFALAGKFADWRQTNRDAPFSVLLSNVTARSINRIDGRDNKIVQNATGDAVLRVYIKDNKIGYEGYPGVAAGKTNPREVILTPACRFSWSQTETTKINSFQVINGPGVFLRLSDVAAIEIIDRNQSECMKLHASTSPQQDLIHQ